MPKMGKKWSFYAHFGHDFLIRKYRENRDPCQNGPKEAKRGKIYIENGARY